MLFAKFLSVSLLTSLVVASVIPEAKLEERQTCTNSATDRACWSTGFSIATDSETSWRMYLQVPVTGSHYLSEVIESDHFSIKCASQLKFF
jgi:hypothetical protein